MLSWQWPDEETYDGYYSDIALFHGQQQLDEGFPVAVERDAEHLIAGRSRANILRAQFPDKTRLIDIGAGTGAFVQAASESGFAAFGLEPCDDLARWAVSIGRAVHPFGWQALIGTYDIITLFDVLEHLTRPLECLKHLAGQLAPKGVMVVEMPEFDSPHQRAHGMKWRHIRPKQHLWLPSRAAAEALFARAALEVIGFNRPLQGSLGKAVWYLQRGI